MFLARRERQERRSGEALTGPVTLPGDPAGAYLEGERRGIAVYAPGGYHWVPDTGNEMLVLKTGQRGEKPCAIGVATGEEGLKPGEILIKCGKASIKLTQDKRVEIKGWLVVNGEIIGKPPAADKVKDKESEKDETDEEDV